MRCLCLCYDPDWDLCHAGWGLYDSVAVSVRIDVIWDRDFSVVDGMYTIGLLCWLGLF